MSYTLPGTIPFCPVNQSYQESVERNVVSFQPSVGRPKERLRSSITDRIIKFSRSMTYTQYSALVTFYMYNVKNGVDKFFAPHPFTGTTATFLFTEPPAMSQLGGRRGSDGKVMVSLSLRQLA